MHKKIILGLAVLLTLSLVFVVQAAFQESYFMPLVYRKLPTATLTPTPTKTPTPTNTPGTPGRSLKTTGVCITNIDYAPKTGGPLNESITIRNLSSSAVNMDNWRILNDKSEKFDIVKFTLNGLSNVKIWTKEGDDDSDELYMDRTEEFWKNNVDCAYLKDDSDPRKTIDSICYDSSTGLFFAPALEETP